MGIASWFGNSQQQLALSRASLALDNSSTCFMIADAQRNIVYANKAVINMLSAAQDDIRKDLPQFSVATLVGSNIDIFHRQPQHQTGILSQLNDTHRAEIKVGGRCFKLILNPLKNEHGEVLGTSVEWHDLTEIKRHELLSLRVTSALDATSSNVMVADVDRNIIFMNKAVEAMLRDAQADLRKALPHFDVDQLLGSNMDIFHKDPSHQRKLLATLEKTYVGNIVVAGRSFRLLANPIFDEQGGRLGSVVEWIDRTKEVAAEQELSRILGALDTTTTNVMIADADRKIIYMNKSVEAMLRDAEADLRAVLPHFSVEKILGSNMDVFHKNPSHQMNLLAKLTKTYTSNIVVGKRHFRLVANPIFDKEGERLGSVVEWLDRTQEVQVESEVNSVVMAAAQGDFTGLINTENKEGFFLALSEGLNSLLRTTENGLNDINRVLKAIAQGDLTERVEAEYQGSFEELKDGCNQTAENLAQMLGEIRLAAETINTAASEISQGNTDLSSRTEQQASSLEETASSMEELTGTVRQNADNAKQANTLSAKASEVAGNGGELIEQVVKTMASINESSQKISDIIGVIDGIAFQTNILALNAAVEAARAGEQGRGFAVVASEVRTLAQRSANAAKDIKSLISDSVSKINNGNELVGKSGDTMKEIVTSIKRVNDIMAEIAAASSEQASGLDEVGKAVNQMDEMTQQNAALVEEAAAAAESLLSQAAQMARNVTKFKLDESHQAMLDAPAPVVSGAISGASSAGVKPIAVKPAQVKPVVKPARSDDDEWESF
ncbi:methyl-accepting chemotaxis protein [Motilimonas eburnea]|uniref:methyl-accepting chemotaxis protein n=1 Tax=Motilimonas eburnea TaxID=1737488 RepID=UPI002551E24B|nr:methyl-accepting chemotaxis protein [Motilimonas eburnea]MCE2572851.1 PAS domain-containing protein [Motilimonas eburnea]